MTLICGGVAVLLVLAGAILALEGEIVGYLLATSWLVCFVTVAALIRRSKLARLASLPSGASGLMPELFRKALILLLVAGHLMLTVGLVGSARRMALDAVSAANLRGIADALREYCARFGEPPATLTDLVRSEIATPGQFICGWDDTQEGFTAGEVNSSYEYRPGPQVCTGDPTCAVVFERGAWTATGLRVFNLRFGRRVLFADGHLETLPEIE